MMIEINGMAHVILTVSRFEVARVFYRELLPRFGMKPVFDGDHLFYCVGGRTAIGIQPCDPALGGERFVQRRVGLHHLCLAPVRARTSIGARPCSMNATIVRGPEEGSWAPGYYSVLFEDPDGIRLEVCFVPGLACWRTARHSIPPLATRPANQRRLEREWPSVLYSKHDRRCPLRMRPVFVDVSIVAIGPHRDQRLRLNLRDREITAI